MQPATSRLCWSESDWLACADPQLMLYFLCGIARPSRCETNDYPRQPSAIPAGKLRQFGCEWWRTMKPHGRHHESICLRVEAGIESKDEEDEYRGSLDDFLRTCLHSGDEYIGADLLREIMGNPFQPKPVIWVPTGIVSDPGNTTAKVGLLAKIKPKWLSDFTFNAALLAHEQRDFGMLPVIADMLEDDGCNEARLMEHLRCTTVRHVRGCWALDLLIGQGG